MIKSINEECGLIGVYNVASASRIAFYGLHSLQHRGQEGGGIVAKKHQQFTCFKGMGLINEVIKDEHLSKLEGYHAIGHTSYLKQEKKMIENVQPLLFKHSTGDFSVAHNGSIINAKELRESLEAKGSIFHSDSDAEVIAHLIKTNKNQNRIEAIKAALNILDGAFAFLIMTKNGLYACRDKHGLRPLCIGTIGDGYVLASESCALEVMGATFLRDVLPGELCYLRDGQLHSYRFSDDEVKNKVCSMEYVYFARPDSTIDNVSVYYSRKKAGELLAKECLADADIVVGVPDSSLPAAAGYAAVSNIPFELALLKNKYIGRTFIAPTQKLRDKAVFMKLSVISPIVKGKRVVLVDDSIVRGTTSRRIVQMLRDAGAIEVHVRIASPTFRFPCYYGVDTETYDELISHKFDVEGVRRIIGADSLYFLSEQGLVESIGIPDTCRACFTNNYPAGKPKCLNN